MIGAWHSCRPADATAPASSRTARSGLRPATLAALLTGVALLSYASIASAKTCGWFALELEVASQVVHVATVPAAIVGLAVSGRGTGWRIAGGILGGLNVAQAVGVIIASATLGDPCSSGPTGYVVAFETVSAIISAGVLVVAVMPDAHAHAAPALTFLAGPLGRGGLGMGVKYVF